MKLKLDLKGDRRLAENVILEIKAEARRRGLEIAGIELGCEPIPVPKTRKPTSPRKPRTRA
jgi:hypothetical protein